MGCRCTNSKHKAFQPGLSSAFKLDKPISCLPPLAHLVRQKPVSNVLARELHRRINRLLSVHTLVVPLVLVPQTMQDLYSLVLSWLVDKDGLEAPLKGSIPFDVLAELINSGRTDDLNGRREGVSYWVEGTKN